MNQAELIAKVAGISGETRRTVESVLKTTADVITVELHEGGEVPLPGLGKIGVKQRAARLGRNPKTGEELQIPAKSIPHFNASKALKDVINL